MQGHTHRRPALPAPSLLRRRFRRAQVATRDQAFLFDLMALAAQHPAELNACLAPLLQSESILKLGFEVGFRARGCALGFKV